MAGRSMATQRLLLGLESSPGTPQVATTKEVLGLKVTPGYQVEGEDFKASGYKVNTSRTQTTEVGSHEVETIQDFNAMTWVLTGGFGKPTSTAVSGAVGNATTHAYELKPKAADTLATFTAIWGDATQSIQMAHFFFNSLGISIQRGQLSLTTSAMSYQPTTGASIPVSGISEVGSIPVASRTWDVYADTTWAGLGTTKLLAAYEGGAEFGDKYVPDYVINSAKTSFDSVIEADDLSPTINLTLGFDADAVAKIGNYANGDLLFIRFASTGPKIDATAAPADIFAKIELDFCIRITSPGTFTTAPNSPAVSLPFEAQLTVDPVSGKTAEATLVNLVTGL